MSDLAHGFNPVVIRDTEELSYDGPAATTYKSPLHEMTQTTPTCLWNDSASIQELTYSIEHGAVGATCNPVIVLGVLKKEMSSLEGTYSGADARDADGDGR